MNLTIDAHEIRSTLHIYTDRVRLLYRFDRWKYIKRKFRYGEIRKRITLSLRHIIYIHWNYFVNQQKQYLHIWQKKERKKKRCISCHINITVSSTLKQRKGLHKYYMHVIRIWFTNLITTVNAKCWNYGENSKNIEALNSACSMDKIYMNNLATT